MKEEEGEGEEVNDNEGKERRVTGGRLVSCHSISRRRRDTDPPPRVHAWLPRPTISSPEAERIIIVHYSTGRACRRQVTQRLNLVHGDIQKQ